jgi:hypothetical protein
VNRGCLKIAGIIGTIAGVYLILAFVIYAWTNGSGHTGMQPYVALGWFVPLAVLGGYLLKAHEVGSREWKWGMASLLVGVLGIALLIFFDVSGTLLNIRMWADRHG